MGAPGEPAATVMCACGNLSRMARSAGRLNTTSPSWPKSMTRILRGSKLIDIVESQKAPKMILTAGIRAREVLSLFSPTRAPVREPDLDPPDGVQRLVKLAPALIRFFAAAARAAAIRAKDQL